MRRCHKEVHDLKAVLRALEPHGVDAGGVRDDVMLDELSGEPDAWLAHAAGYGGADDEPGVEASADEGESQRSEAAGGGGGCGRAAWRRRWASRWRRRRRRGRVRFCRMSRGWVAR